MTMKTYIDYLHASSLRDLIDTVNYHNRQFPETPILKDDIVSIQEGDNGYVLLYYKQA